MRIRIALQKFENGEQKFANISANENDSIASLKEKLGEKLLELLLK